MSPFGSSKRCTVSATGSHRGLRCLLSAVLAGAFMLPLASCGAGSESAQQDVLTQKITEDGRQQISVLVKNAFAINGFEQAVEEKFPDIDIVQVGNHTRDMGIAEYEARLANDDIPDMVMTWPYDIGEQYWGDELLDLAGMGFTDRYNLSMLGDLSRDGELYYLPGPAQVRGIVYNKTLFEERGWEVPKNFDGFVSLCKTIEASGMRSLQLGLGNSEVLDTAFTGYGYADCYSKPQDKLWIKSYNNGEGSFGDHFAPALDTFQTLIDEKILQPGDLDLTYADRETMFFGRQCAMIEDSALMVHLGETIWGSSDEFALMPFFNPGDGGDWARLYMVCYIGLSQHLAEPRNAEKYDLVMKLMDYISTPEGQKALMADTGAMFSSLVGMGAPDTPEIEKMQTALQYSRYGTFPTLENAQDALREGLAGMVRGELTAADVTRMVDAQNASPVAAQEPETIGQASEDFSLTDTGGFVTDALREAGGSDLALFLDNGKDGRNNGKGISARLYGGPITETDIGRVLPDLRRGELGTLWVVSMTGADLLETLEHSITVDSNQGGWFYYFSGLRMEYAPAAEPGERIRSVTLTDGSAVDPDRVYTVSIMDETVPDGFIQSCEKTDRTIKDILETAVREAGTVSPSKDGRLTIAEF
ncbi:MAG: extracellular solute-binding protein [Gordonibacter sp.]|uniref:extracellular solute-binding protein n=1 Tax=Gordonibacter sp. TaxID=1968902 RepID=UPI0032206ED4